MIYKEIEDTDVDISICIDFCLCKSTPKHFVAGSQMKLNF